MSAWGATLLIAVLFLLVLGWRVLDPRPRLSIDARGIRHRGLPLGCIRWDEIEGAYPPSVEDSDALHLKLRLTERLRRRLRRQRSPLPSVAAGPRSLEIRLDLAGTDIGPVELLQEILAHTLARRDALAVPAPGAGLPASRPQTD